MEHVKRFSVSIGDRPLGRAAEGLGSRSGQWIADGQLFGVTRPISLPPSLELRGDRGKNPEDESIRAK